MFFGVGLFYEKVTFFIFEVNKKLKNDEFCDARHLMRSFRGYAVFDPKNPKKPQKLTFLGFFDFFEVGRIKKWLFAIF